MDKITRFEIVHHEANFYTVHVYKQNRKMIVHVRNNKQVSRLIHQIEQLTYPPNIEFRSTDMRLIYYTYHHH